MKPPVFLVGPARSGTSLLYKSLCLHPDAAWVSNYVRRLPALPQLAVLNRVCAPLPGMRRTVWFNGGANAYVYGQRRPLTHRLFPMPVEGEPVYARCRIGATPADPPPAAPDLARLRGTFRAVARAGGGQVLVNKRIANNLRIPLLAQAMPDARFIFLVRDGRAVAHSLSKVDWWPESIVWWYGATPRQWVAEGGDPWELCARNWVEELRAAEHGLASVPAAQRLDLRYEDFVAAPLDTLEQVARFAGLGPDPRWRRELRALRFPDRNEGWRQSLEPAVADRISAVQRAALGRYGYLEMTQESQCSPS